jgi:uncharacterized membrane protein YdbT with pleckstrin-like domain
MNPDNPNFDPKRRVGNELTTMQPGEKVIAVIKRHPIGIIGIYVAIAFVLTLVALLAFGLIPSMSTGGSNQATGMGALVFLIAASISFVYALIATKVYWANSWVITSDSITQVSQSGLFSRQSSQLSLENLEDVTAEQHGILAHTFNYGVLKAETAGERSKFSFLYCPNPNLYAQQILHAREQFAQAGHSAGADRQPSANTTSEPVTNPEPPQSSGSGFNSNV